MREISDTEKNEIKQRAHENCRLMMFGNDALDLNYDAPDILKNQIDTLEFLRRMMIKNNFNNLSDFYFFKYSTDFIICILKNSAHKDDVKDYNLSSR